MIIRTFQQKGIRKNVPYPEINADRCNGISKNFLYPGIDINLLHEKIFSLKN